VFSIVISRNHLGRRGLDNLLIRILLIRGLLLLADNILRRVDLLWVGLESVLSSGRYRYEMWGSKDEETGVDAEG
jgi:hypothetical protein